jgi:hypothetical protein
MAVLVWEDTLHNCAQKLRAQRNDTLLELAKLEFDLRLPTKRCERKSSPDLDPAHQDFVHPRSNQPG